MNTSRLQIKDKKGRIVLKINEFGKIAIARFPDITEKEKNNLLKICEAIIQDNTNFKSDMEKIKAFINFESDDDEFCS